MSQVTQAEPTSPSWNILGDSCFPKQYVMHEESKEKPKTDNISKIKLKLQDIKDAHTRIKNDVVFTPVIVNMLIETSDMHHAKELEKKLMKEYPHSHFIML